MSIDKENLKRIGSVWLVPIIAAMIGIALLINNISNRGPEIKLMAKTASGLSAGKTEIKYLSVAIGKITDIEIAPDGRGVVLTAQLSKGSENYLGDGTKFWVVRTRIDTQGVSGLDTLLSGAYIQLSPVYTQDAFKKSFELLDEEIYVDNQDKGSYFKLSDTTQKPIGVGEPVSYRGKDVGVVTSADFSVEERKMNYNIFVRSPYDVLVTENTKFWVSSALDIDFGPQGLNVNVSSMKNFVKGGITFDVPKNTSIGEPARAGSNFKLYAKYKDTTVVSYPEYVDIMLLFDELPRGVQEETAVLFRGIQIGEVVEAPYSNIYVGKQWRETKIPVLVRIHKGRLDPNNEMTMEQFESDVNESIAEDLYAKLENVNIISGVSVIVLDADKQIHDSINIPVAVHDGYPVVPVAKSSMQTIADDAGQIVSNLKNLKIDESINQLNELMAQTNKTMEKMNKILDHLEGSLDPKNKESLISEIKQAIISMRQAVSAFDSDSEFYHNLVATMAASKMMMEEISTVMRKTSESPNRYVLGSDIEDDEPKASR